MYPRDDQAACSVPLVTTIPCVRPSDHALPGPISWEEGCFFELSVTEICEEAARAMGTRARPRGRSAKGLLVLLRP